ncbi:MAG: hypothetical protein H6712_18270 [Myxococcales bacterium]|nr:hypothetical protein [Myxococcales bacterium]MCB9715819.1 hypothetical protein [Myxococcales bacterium]
MTQLHALGLTLAIEGAVGALLLWLWWGRRGASLAVAIVVVLACSLLTHPLAWQANRVWLHGLRFPVRAAIIEGAVVLLEAAILRYGLARRAGDEAPPSWWRCLGLSLAANAASFGYGLWRLG